MLILPLDDQVVEAQLGLARRVDHADELGDGRLFVGLAGGGERGEGDEGEQAAGKANRHGFSPETVRRV